MTITSVRSTSERTPISPRVSPAKPSPCSMSFPAERAG